MTQVFGWLWNSGRGKVAERRRISAREVAGLDPFGVRQDAAGELEAILDKEDTKLDNAVAVSREFEIPLIGREKEAWEKVLGVEVSVKPIPEFVDEQAVEKLKGFGLELRYIPKIILGDRNSFWQGVEAYLKGLERRYPNWRRHEGLTIAEKKDPDICRNLEEEYWQLVKTRQIFFPKLAGYWIAAETFPKPRPDHFYPPTDAIPYPRFGMTRNFIEDALQFFGPKILHEAGLGEENSKVDLLTPLEWNLLGNRERWGNTISSEWTRVGAIAGWREENAVVVGGGGAGYISVGYPFMQYPHVGFRVGVYFKEKRKGE